MRAEPVFTTHGCRRCSSVWPLTLFFLTSTTRSQARNRGRTRICDMVPFACEKDPFVCNEGCIIVVKEQVIRIIQGEDY